MKVVILDDYQDAVKNLDCYHKIRNFDVMVYNDTVKDVARLSERLKDAEAIVLIRERTAITDEVLSRLPELKVICQTSRGIAHIDLEACTQHGVAVTVGTPSPYAPAELCWGLILSAVRHIPTEVVALKSKQWQTTIGRALAGRTLGIFGYGNIGTLVARYGKAFSMNILIWGRESTLARARNDGHEVSDSKEDFFTRSDVLTLQLPLVEGTRGIVGQSDLARMKSSAVLINTSRAALVQPGALLSALKAGRPGFAAVDVYEDEPAVNHPLIGLDNVVCTPHLGFVERDNYELYFGEAFDNLLAFCEGKPQSIINPEVL
ncbi:D-2-hydroxyacid dehydrogenase family protein [Halomonas kalidii]|uniref:D-2-hydroxyacid dehydrogenase family protein n=1 Tax=Halomonas kalidii TaxID=3043293 RepID=A0ABT6VMR7_9GAMM|nr:D-2-hydroxyacid dehydrogenase family protein [Halomonas kalidii]MDI5935288.1 D-2-hydroxyacid dehydrogenase family protein [Halomonas kalidii]